MCRWKQESVKNTCQYWNVNFTDSENRNFSQAKIPKNWNAVIMPKWNLNGKLFNFRSKAEEGFGCKETLVTLHIAEERQVKGKTSSQ